MWVTLTAQHRPPADGGTSSTWEGEKFGIFRTLGPLGLCFGICSYLSVFEKNLWPVDGHKFGEFWNWMRRDAQRKFRKLGLDAEPGPMTAPVFCQFTPGAHRGSWLVAQLCEPWTLWEFFVDYMKQKVVWQEDKSKSAISCQDRLSDFIEVRHGKTC